MSHKAQYICQSIAQLPTQFGNFQISCFSNSAGDSHLALTRGNIVAQQHNKKPILVRMHSQCLTGDALNSIRCDCNAQLQQAMRIIAKEGVGVIIYLMQEGRGIGIAAKVAAYALQDTGLDSVDANRELGFKDDLRNYDMCIDMLKHFGVKNIALMTNNPKKIQSLKAQFNVSAKSHKFGACKSNQKYLDTKRDRMGHLL